MSINNLEDFLKKNDGKLIVESNYSKEGFKSFTAEFKARGYQSVFFDENSLKDLMDKVDMHCWHLTEELRSKTV